MRKCIFFDRDGIVNYPPGPGYVERWQDFRIIPEFVDVYRMFISKGYDGVVVTNQRGVATGVMTSEALADIHDHMKKTLQDQYGVAFLDVMVCTHDKTGCECRKPKPGMFLEAARRHDIDLSQSWMIGDNKKDMEAGKNAGCCKTILVSDEFISPSADHTVKDMAGLKTLVASLLGI